MFKVLIIDDELIVRKGLRSIVKWEQYNCEICGEAADGIEGYKLISELRPDIIFTDVNMQDMDGLTMLREVKELLINSKIIILTGYRDFEYAKEAITLGVFDFLLKPSRIDEINSVLTRVVAELNHEKAATEKFERFKIHFEENMPVLREKLLYDIMLGINTDSNEVTAKSQLLKINLPEFLLVVIENDYEGEDENDETNYNRQLYQFGISKYFAEAFCDYDVISISLSLKRMAFIVSTERVGFSYDRFCDRCAGFQQSVSLSFGFTVTIGLSSQGNDIFELSKKLKECRSALQQKLYIGNNSLICYKDLDASFRYEDYSMLNHYNELLLDGIKSGNIDGVNENLQNIFNFINESISALNKDIKDFYWNTLSSINNIRISVLGIEKNDSYDKQQADIPSYTNMDNLYHLIAECDSIQDMHDILTGVCLKLTEKINNYNHKNIGLMVQAIINYINLNYKEPITLKDIGEHIYVSTYYVSRIFKQRTGKTLIDYLNEVRLEKAKKLLMDVQYKVYEVADLVGITNPHYFSKIFKKHAGMTPKEFRDANYMPEN